jgi:SAM-dependent methyltransferase
MLQTEAKVEAYLGTDLFRESIEWANINLTPVNPAFRFLHHDVFNAQFNSSSQQEFVPFQTGNEFFTLVTAHSVFTHIIERNLRNYLSECRRLLTPDGIFRSSWFLFDKTSFPMMQEFQNCLYINVDDPTNATVYDYNYIRSLFIEYGMTIYSIIPPPVRGFQWFLLAKAAAAGAVEMEFPADVAPIGICRPPVDILD